MNVQHRDDVDPDTLAPLWNLTMNAPRVENGKNPDEPINANLLFWLPPDTPYGNFQLKAFKLVERVDELNRRITEAFALWTHCRSSQMLATGTYQRHVFVLEQCVFLMRRIADELISLIHCLSAWEGSGTYPDRIEINCIGALMHAAPAHRLCVFGPHMPVLETLNSISNAYKHSFINSDNTLIGEREPSLHALDLKRNNLVAGAKFHNVPCAALVADFNRLYVDANGWLRQFSERHRIR